MTNQSIKSLFNDNIFDKDAKGFTRSRVHTQNEHANVTNGLILRTKCLDHCSITPEGGIVKCPGCKVPIVFRGQDEVMRPSSKRAHGGGLVNK